MIKSRPKLLTSIFLSVFVFSLTISLTMLIAPISAAPTNNVNEQAEKYCKDKYKGRDLINPCVEGYTKGYKGEDADCNKFPDRGGKKIVCQNAYDGGVDDSQRGDHTGGDGNGNPGGGSDDAGCTQSKCDLIKQYLNPTINLLSVIFGLVAAGSLILGGIQFSTSEGDPQKAASAKDRIAGTILAIFAYAFIYAFLQFLIPGGLFNR